MTKRCALLLVCLLCASARADNVYTGDAACEAVWRFESSALTTDSSGNGNTLTASGSPTADTDAGDFKQGSGSCYFDGTDDYFTMAQASLSTGYPLAGAQSDFSLAMWFRVDALPANAAYYGLYWKYLSGANTYSLSIFRDATNTRLVAMIGYNSGSSWETESISSYALTADVWYHVTWTWANSAKAWTAYIYSEATGTTTTVGPTTTTYAPYVSETSNVFIGSTGGWSSVQYMLGWLDEVVMFSDVLSEAEAGQVRAGTYGSASSAKPAIHRLNRARRSS